MEIKHLCKTVPIDPVAYQEAERYLRQVAKLFKELKRAGEWESYLQDLRRIHFRKRRLMKILDS